MAPKTQVEVERLKRELSEAKGSAKALRDLLSDKNKQLREYIQKATYLELELEAADQLRTAITIRNLVEKVEETAKPPEVDSYEWKCGMSREDRWEAILNDIEDHDWVSRFINCMERIIAIVQKRDVEAGSSKCHTEDDKENKDDKEDKTKPKPKPSPSHEQVALKITNIISLCDRTVNGHLNQIPAYETLFASPDMVGAVSCLQDLELQIYCLIEAERRSKFEKRMTTTNKGKSQVQDLNRQLRKANALVKALTTRLTSEGQELQKSNLKVAILQKKLETADGLRTANKIRNLVEKIEEAAAPGEFDSYEWMCIIGRETRWQEILKDTQCYEWVNRFLSCLDRIITIVKKGDMVASSTKSKCCTENAKKDKKKEPDDDEEDESKPTHVEVALIVTNVIELCNRTVDGYLNHIPAYMELFNAPDMEEAVRYLQELELEMYTSNEALKHQNGEKSYTR
ncbi:uncharacterized protein LOC135844903 [Planococcus citri]|uniref:uncharacterized protein LOC135844903 n=1 Tax=Planococcus citri TaxID=170843 RepID=UPI0031F95DB1